MLSVNKGCNASVQVLKGSYFYAFGDHGGLVIAIKQKETTNEFL